MKRPGKKVTWLRILAAALGPGLLWALILLLLPMGWARIASWPRSARPLARRSGWRRSG